MRKKKEAQAEKEGQVPAPAIIVVAIAITIIVARATEYERAIGKIASVGRSERRREKRREKEIAKTKDEEIETAIANVNIDEVHAVLQPLNRDPNPGSLARC